jgi:hypothetical protein
MSRASKPAEHDLNPVAALAAAPAVLEGFTAQIMTRDRRIYRLVSQRISETVSIIAPVRQPPFGFRQTSQQGVSTGVVADHAGSHEGADRAAISIRDGIPSGIHTTDGVADRATCLSIAPPIQR